ncbi:non-ribosomal peptide synthetase [Smaragdicoccus niigatensis]|uniref:non-ribosomal peptide synthetase n=3 Tax=Smaragdicoccus niigatensis TaxID=359359 RepID=UPI00037BEC3E|nr:non-ribosomal peptide synthetase [Smaragdicoccus niigatensis]
MKRTDADRVESVSADSATLPVLEVPDHLDLERFALTHAQTELWIAQQLHPSVPMVIAMYADIRGEIEPNLLMRACDQAGRELGSPFVRFGVDDGVPYQYVDRSGTMWLPLEDLSMHPDPMAPAIEWMERDSIAHIDLVNDRVTVTKLFRLSATRHLLYSRSHHVALDGVGAMNMLVRTSELYDARIAGQPDPEDRTVPLTEIGPVEDRYRSSQRFVDDGEFWRREVSDLGHVTSLADHDAAPAPRPRHVGAVLPASTAARLAEARQRYRASFPELVVAALTGFLARMTSDEDITFSLPVACRNTAALRRSAGSVSNVVPLRLRSVQQTNVEDLIAQVRTKMVGAVRHQLYRYSDIQRQRGHEMVARGGLGPVINVLGYVEPMRFGAAVGQANLMSLGPVEDILVNGYQLGADEKSASIDFQANPALYSSERIAEHHAAFLQFFDQFLQAEPTRAIRDIELPGSAAPEPIPVLRADEIGRTLPELLRSGMRPDAAAISDDTRTLTYRDLDERSSQLARELISAGAGPGEFVAIALPRSIESVLAVWAVAKTGAGFVTLDLANPSSRLGWVLEDSHARFGITDARHLAPLPESHVDWLVLDDPATARSISRRDSSPVTDADRAAALRSGHPAYLIYTSGSTGLPKGVAVSHAGLGDLTDYVVAAYAVDSSSNVLHAHSPSFDAHLLELLGAFAAGAHLILEPTDVVAGKDLESLLVRHGITHFLTTPAVLATLTPKTVPALETVVVGGESCPTSLVARWAPHVRFFNSYGPTETTVMASQTDAMTAGEEVSIGPALPYVQALVLTPQLSPAPRGARGELYLAGPGVALGYHNAPGLTASRFVANPFDPSGQRLYRTGDVVRQMADGRFEFLGRADGQMSLRGRRIEPGEIETVLVNQPEVGQAVVAVASSPLGDRLVAYVVPRGNAAIETSDLLSRVRGLLPTSMQPSQLIVIDEMPVTPNGKIDRKALPAPRSVHRAFRPPVTATEQLVARVIADTVQQRDIGLDDDFFELGGNSLLGVALAARLTAESGVDVTVRWLYTAPTVSALAEKIDAALAGEDVAAGEDALKVVLPLSRTGSEPPLFCVHSAVPLAWPYAGLAPYVKDRPLYGLQGPAILGEDRRFQSVDELAAVFVDEIKNVQPNGPYYLLGWSLGGQIAHAIAVQLRSRGDAVGLLVMFDSLVFFDGAPEPELPTMRHLLTSLQGEEPDEVDESDLSAQEAAAVLANSPGFGQGLTVEQLERIHNSYHDGVLMSHQYRPKYFEGDLLYFSATRGMTAALDSHIWRPYVGGAITEHPVDAMHAQLTNAAALAVIGPVLATSLDKASVNFGSSPSGEE